MITPGINLEETEFRNVRTSPAHPPDFASVVYEAHRCNEAHGDDLPSNFELIPAVGSDITRIEITAGGLRLPDRLPFGLIALAVLEPVNRGQSVPDGYFFSLGSEEFPINDWWGRKDDFRPIAARYSKTRVKLQGLDEPW
jgi:hypothetical protein